MTASSLRAFIDICSQDYSSSISGLFFSRLFFLKTLSFTEFIRGLLTDNKICGNRY